MKLEYTGSEQVPLGKPDVWAFINDPQKVASCLPDVQQVTVHDATNFDAVVAIGLGPVRGKFKFKITLEPQPGGERMNVRINGGGFGSVVDLLAGADLKDNGDSTTTLDWDGSATMRGPIATVGGRVLDAQAQKLISGTFANVKTRMAGA
jgi:carbon monoxide dehydrogenase subunit G